MLLMLLTCLVFLFPTTFVQNDTDSELLGGLGDYSPEEIGLLLVVFTAPVSIPALLLMGWRNNVGLKKQSHHLAELATLNPEQEDEHLESLRDG